MNKLSTGEQGKKLIKKFEGLRLESYKCSAGKWTIGWGHTGAVHGQDIDSSTKITREYANTLFNADLKIFEHHVNKKVRRKLNQNEFDALVSWCFNLGPRLHKSTLLLVVEDLELWDIPVYIEKGMGNVYVFAKDDKDYNGQMPNIDYQFLRWTNVNGKPDNGIYRRRKIELSLFLKDPNDNDQMELGL